MENGAKEVVRGREEGMVLDLHWNLLDWNWKSIGLALEHHSIGIATALAYGAYLTSISNEK